MSLFDLTPTWIRFVHEVAWPLAGIVIAWIVCRG